MPALVLGRSSDDGKLHEPGSVRRVYGQPVGHAAAIDAVRSSDISESIASHIIEGTNYIRYTPLSYTKVCGTLRFFFLCWCIDSTRNSKEKCGFCIWAAMDLAEPGSRDQDGHPFHSAHNDSRIAGAGRRTFCGSSDRRSCGAYPVEEKRPDGG